MKKLHRRLFALAVLSALSAGCGTTAAPGGTVGAFDAAADSLGDSATSDGLGDGSAADTAGADSLGSDGSDAIEPLDGSSDASADGAELPDGTSPDAADPDGADGSDVAQNQAPKLWIGKPEPGSVVAKGSKIAVELSGSDDGAPTDTYKLSCSVDGKSGMCDGLVPKVAGKLGEVTVTAEFSWTADLPGQHTLAVELVDAQGLADQASVTVLVDTPPTAPKIALEPASPTVADAVEAKITQESVDADGGAISYVYSWSVDGKPVAGDTAKQPAGVAKKGQLLSVVVVAKDALGSSEAVSAEVKIANSVPTKGNYQLIPENPSVVAILEAKQTAAATDADGDVLTVSYVWTIAGEKPNGAGATLNLAGLKLPSGAAVKVGDSVDLVVEVSDGSATTAAIVSGTPAKLGPYDACAGGVNPCSANATCAVGGDFAAVCTCKAGYSGDGKVCSDIDECLAKSAGCHADALCTNLPGSASCACKPGYAGDGKSCIDVDECQAGTAGCAADATCSNSPGSFACACKPGYSGNGKACGDVDECATANGGCDANATCKNSAGSFSCTCNAFWEGNGKSCSDVNECAANNGACGTAPVYTCKNQTGAAPLCEGPFGPNLPQGALIISEIMYNPATATDDKGEWFEVTNGVSTELELGGIVIRSGPNKFVVPVGTKIAAGGILVFGLNKDLASNGGAPVDVAMTATQTALLITLANSGSDEIVLESNGKVIDSVTYDFAAGWPSANGASISLSSDKLSAEANDDKLSWCVSIDAFGMGDKGTPGKLNPKCSTDKDKDGIDDALDNCPLAYNADQKDTDSDKLGDACDNCAAKANADQADADSDKVGNLCDNCPATANADQKDVNGNGIGDVCDSSATCGNKIVEAGETCDDGAKVAGDGCDANCQTESTGNEPSPGDLVITEIMVDPSAVNDDKGEWFEVKNVSSKAFDLKGMVVQGASTSDKFTVTMNLTIGAGKTLVFAVSSDPAVNGNVSAQYQYSASAFPQSNSNVDVIDLQWKGVSIDKVQYQWGATATGWPVKQTGATLQLSNSKTSANLNDTPANWCLASKAWSGADLGSPGTDNAECGIPAPTGWSAPSPIPAWWQKFLAWWVS